MLFGGRLDCRVARPSIVLEKLAFEVYGGEAPNGGTQIVLEHELRITWV